MGADGLRQAPAALSPEKKTHCTGGKVGPRVGTGGCGTFRLHQDSIPGESNLYQVVLSTTHFTLMYILLN